MKKINISGKYILDKNGKPKAEPDLMKWAAWFESTVGTKARVLDYTEIPLKNGMVSISTVFLGLDHNFVDIGKGKPVLWETMIFGSKHKALKEYQVRYTAVSNAKKGHKYSVGFAKHILNVK